MKSSISIVFAIALFSGLMVPAFSQSSPDHVVINEVDTNPFGDDSKSITEWVELYNPTDTSIDIGGWKIASTTTLKKTLTIPFGTIIKPDQFITYSYQSLWFTDVSEVVELRDTTGTVVDKTPSLTDQKNDFTSWQRIYDGYDSDNISDWKFATSTAGSSNGKLVASEENAQVTITISTNKDSFLFGETAVISGSVSEKIFVEKPYFYAEPIIMKITGPQYVRDVTLYPDLSLNYKTTINLYQVLGINEGEYQINVSYAGATAQTSFTVGHEIITKEETQEGALTMSTDKTAYIPGQTLLLSGSTSEVIPLEGLKFTITNPKGTTIASGTLFPINGKFSTSVFLSTVNPVYGQYKIVGEYFKQAALTTFEVVQDYKEDTAISLWTDKEAYSLGETVKITGRLNNLWVSSLDLEILQTTNTALGVKDFAGGGYTFKVIDSVRLAGDSTFSYSFTIPSTDVGYGDYRIKVSKEVGSATKSIHVVADPSSYSADKEPLSLTTDKAIYSFGDKMKISGLIANPKIQSSYETPSVKISISNKDGSPLSFIGLPTGARTLSRDGVAIAYEFTAIPDPSGRYLVDTSITRSIFSEGDFVIKAQYQNLSKTTTISITDPLNTGAGAVINLDKQVYGLNETVHLTGLLPISTERSVSITLTKPDGTKIDSAAHIDNNKFSWSWTTPISQKTESIKSTDDRSVAKSNIGVYKIHVKYSSQSKDLFFKVSLDPQNDSLIIDPISVSTEKSLYKPGEKLKVLGSVQTRIQGTEGLIVPDRVSIKVLSGKFPFPQIHEASVYPDQGGNFQSLFELPATIFSQGEYIVKASYNNKQAETRFSVVNDFVFGGTEKIMLLASTDKSQYYPGDVITVSGGPNKLVYLEQFQISVIKKDSSQITCGSFYCGTHQAPVTSIRPGPSGLFSYEYQIPNTASSLGSYEITIDVGFDTKSLVFDVVEKPQETEVVQPETQQASKLIEKVNRISENSISITTQEKSVEDKQLTPRVLMGSLITPSRGEESQVNLKITTDSGLCVIGQEEDCLVKESTRKLGSIYDIVEIDGISFKVRYSGLDAQIEKFTILPESDSAFLPNMTWQVDIIKEEQTSRFYYKVNYQAE